MSLSDGPALVLASSSPRRRDLLGRLGLTPDRIESPAIDESPKPNELPRAYALRLAIEKAAAVGRRDGEVVIAGDTTIALGRRILLAPEPPSAATVAHVVDCSYRVITRQVRHSRFPRVRPERKQGRRAQKPNDLRIV